MASRTGAGHSAYDLGSYETVADYDDQDFNDWQRENGYAMGDPDRSNDWHPPMLPPEEGGVESQAGVKDFLVGAVLYTAYQLAGEVVQRRPNAPPPPPTQISAPASPPPPQKPQVKAPRPKSFSKIPPKVVNRLRSLASKVSRVGRGGSPFGIAIELGNSMKDTPVGKWLEERGIPAGMPEFPQSDSIDSE